MWHQRRPDLDVDRTKGWEGVCLPFTAELVTTHQKGELTHFFEGSTTGHEYWLREFNGGSLDPNDNTIYVARFTYPKAPNIGDTKNATNTFLWDYYYKGLTGGHNQKDDNDDTYQEYYRRLRTYERYAFLSSGTPYLLGLPGVTYYEFDLSGNFVAQNTAATIDKLDKQILTFASETGTSIKASDSEMNGVKPTGSAYTFKPNYLNKTVPVNENYTLNVDGSSYDKVTGEASTVYAFRPFFTSGTADSRTRSIVFSDEQSDLKGANEHSRRSATLQMCVLSQQQVLRWRTSR